jgi:hypothetical protein
LTRVNDWLRSETSLYLVALGPPPCAAMAEVAKNCRPRDREADADARFANNKVALGGISAQGGGRRRRQKDRRAQPDARTRGESSAGGRAIIARLRMMTPPGEVCSLETRGYLFPAEVDRRACSQRLEELSRSRICVKRRRDRAMLSPIRSSAEPGGGAGIVRAAGGCGTGITLSQQILVSQGQAATKPPDTGSLFAGNEERGNYMSKVF